MTADRRTSSSTKHAHRPSRLLLIWLAGFSLIGLVATVILFNVVRDIVRHWNTTALAAPAVSSGVTLTDPETGQPVINIPDWNGIERVTVLLLGIDERKQETGPFRTDTMLLLTVDPASKMAGMLSIPRDLWVQIPAMETEGKINIAHFLGDAYDYPGGGPALAMDTVRENLGIPVDYFVRLNFDAFRDVIDAIGGVEICVPETIDDPDYPAYDNYGFDPLYIPAGCQTMGGELALKYARTRHGGTDFDRAKRQQQVILAVRDKVIKQNLLPQLVAQAPGLLDTLQASVQTDLSLDQMIQLAKLATQIDPQNIKQAVIDENMVVAYNTPTNPPQNVLVPIRSKLRELREQFLNLTPLANPTGEAAPPAIDQARLRIENGTQINGLAAQTRDRLIGLGFNVVEIDSADRFDYDRSQIISYRSDVGVAAAAAQALGLPASSIVTSTAHSLIDLKIILGSDYQPPAATAAPQ
jgi:LCP family protein required for cell wall assembly